jgi:hypothetical protein
MCLDIYTLVTSRVGDKQDSYQSRRSYTAELDKRSINGIPVCPAPAKEMPATGEKRNPKKSASQSA